MDVLLPSKFKSVIRLATRILKNIHVLAYSIHPTFMYKQSHHRINEETVLVN
jgi:hypothetical protein